MRYLVLIGFVLFSNHLFSQYIYSDTTWERWYGTENYNEYSFSNKNDIEYYDNGYIFHGFNGYSGAYKAMIKKTDINGFFIWERRFDSIYSKIILGVKNFSSGGLLINGQIDISGTPNPWAAKLNACMEVEWCRIFSWPEFSYAIDIAEDQNGDIIVLTDFYGYGPNERIGLIKISPDGDILWKKSYATRDDYPYIWNAFGKKLIISNDNNYYIAGEAEWPSNNDPEQGSGERSFFIKVNPNGEEEWILPFGIYDGLYSYAHSIWQLNDQSFTSVGFNWDSLCPVIMHFNHLGEELSFQTKRIMPETYDVNMFSSTELINSNLFFSFWRYSYDYYDPPLSGYIVYDSLLNIIDYKETPDILPPFNIIKTHNNKIITVATMKEQENPAYYDIYINKQNIDFTYDSVYTAWSGSYDSLCDGGVVSGFIPYTCETIVGINEIPTPEQYKEAQEKIGIKVQPNPSQTQTTLLLENTIKFKNIELEIFNIAGEKQYYQKIISGTGEININISNWSQGMYFIIIRSQGKMVGDTKLTVVQ